MKNCSYFQRVSSFSRTSPIQVLQKCSYVSVHIRIPYTVKHSTESIKKALYTAGDIVELTMQRLRLRTTNRNNKYRAENSEARQEFDERYNGTLVVMRSSNARWDSRFPAKLRLTAEGLSGSPIPDAMVQNQNQHILGRREGWLTISVY